jgi:hypothetical protein
MARPQKIQDWLVQRVADMFRYAHRLTEAHTQIGRVLCNVPPADRPWFLNRLADALRKKPRKSSPDAIALVQEACRRARSKLKGLYKDDDPTWKEANAEFFKLTGYKRDRRSIKDAGERVRPDKPGRPKKLPRR